MDASQQVDNYIQSFPEPVQGLLHEMRAIITATAPQAVESMSYGMPAYKINNKPLVYFAGNKNHIGFYATPNGHEAFKTELATYKGGKGSVQFPLHQKLPVTLIKRIVKFRMNNILALAKKT